MGEGILTIRHQLSSELYARAETQIFVDDTERGYVQARMCGSGEIFSPQFLVNLEQDMSVWTRGLERNNL
jgi:hypothetical protein